MLTLEYLETLEESKRLEVILAEYIKCVQDPLYTIRNYLPLADPDTGEESLFDPYPYQNAATQDFEVYDYNMTMKTRQTGLTTIAQAYTAWFMATKKKKIVNALAQEKKISKKFLKGVHDFLDGARKRAPWLIPDYEEGHDNKESFGLKNGSTIIAEANKPDACRGDTLSLLIIDEVAAISWMEDIWAAAGLTLTRSNGKCIAISCVTKDTYVYTDKGIQQLEDFIPLGVDHNEKKTYNIDSYNLYGKGKKRLGDSFHVNGYGETKRITTPYAEIEGSLEHKFWAFSDGKYQWVKIKNLTLGDYVNVQYGMNCWGNDDDVSDFNPIITNNHKDIFKPTKLTPDICYLLGLYIAEGHSSQNSTFITCDDGISDIFSKLKLPYCQQNGGDNKFEVPSKTLIDFFEYLGFDLTKKAHSKEIPKRLMSISKNNMKALLQGIFDGDGYSTLKKNRVGVSVKSEKLIEQLRVILGNFGVLSYKGFTSKEQLNGYYNKKGIKHNYDTHSLEINDYFATEYHNKIGFRAERKAKVKKRFENFSSNIPNGQELLREVCKIGKTSIDTLRTKHKIYVHYNKNIDRTLFNKVCVFLETKDPEILNNSRYQEIKDKILIENSIWVPIIDIKNNKNYTYDFDLPKNKEDFWDKSAVYNNVLIYDTPKGNHGWYFEQYTNAKENGWNIINAHWSEHPIYNLGLYRWIEDKTHKDDGYVKFMNGDTWPDMSNIKNIRKYKCNSREGYGFIRDGRIRSPWYDFESKRLGKQKTRCELDCSFSGSGGEVLDPEVIRDHESIANKTKRLNEPGKGAWKSFKVFKEPKEFHKYILTADAATGDGSDYSAFVVIDLTTMEIVATYKDQFDNTKYAEIINKVGRKYNNALLIIEHQFGLSSLLTLRDVYKYKNIYYTTLKKEDPTLKDKKKKIGFWQSEGTRSLGGDKLEEVLNKMILTIPCINIVNEMHNWIWTKAGRRDHASGKHDDLLMSLTMAIFYIYYVNVKQENYRDSMRKTIERNTLNLGDTFTDEDFDMFLM
jgi:hypothetical protein